MYTWNRFAFFYYDTCLERLGYFGTFDGDIEWLNYRNGHASKGLTGGVV